MKKIKFEGKLSLNKEVISQLNEDQMIFIKGGDRPSKNGCTQIGPGCATAGVTCKCPPPGSETPGTTCATTL